jgi:hypothetical protein
MADFETVHDALDHTGLTGVGGAGYDEGTSFPVSPTTGDKFFHNTYDMLFFYDGTRWLTTTLYREQMGFNTAAHTVAGNIARMAPWHTTFDLWLETFYATTFVSTTNSGSAYWNLTLQKANAADAKTTIVTFNTSTHTVNNWTTTETAIGALLVPATYKEVDVQTLKTSTPGGLFCSLHVTYRLVGT